jgi:predicted nucleic acid-binding protein
LRFLDSNVFVYHMASDARYGDKAEKILTRIESGEEALTSTLVIVQVCWYLKCEGSVAKIPLFLALLQSLPSLTKDETSFEDFTAAVSLAESHGMPWKMWDDLVIAAQMKRLGLREIYSNDADFDRIPGIHRVF